MAFMVRNTSALASTICSAKRWRYTRRCRHHEAGRAGERSYLRALLGLGLMFGTAGLPHILMRFFRSAMPAKHVRACSTPPDLWALLHPDLYYRLWRDHAGRCESEYKDAAGHLIGGNNMAAVHRPMRWAATCSSALFQRLLSPHSCSGCGSDAGGRIGGVSRPYANVFKKGATEREELRVSKTPY